MTFTPEEVIINGPFKIKTGAFKTELRDQNGNIIPSLTPDEIRIIRKSLRLQIVRSKYHSTEDHNEERRLSSEIETLNGLLEKLK
jgi:hypothetical protein